jgi:hypothetical protein
MVSGLPGERFFGGPNLYQRRFPPAFQLTRDKAVVWINPVELPLGKGCGVPLAFELMLGTGAQRRVQLMLGPASA